MGKIFQLLLLLFVYFEGNVTFLHLRQLCIEFLDGLLSLAVTLHERETLGVEVAATSNLTHRFCGPRFYLTALLAPLKPNHRIHYQFVST